MAMSKEDRFIAALKMIQVTPENYNILNAEMILCLYDAVAKAEEQLSNRPTGKEGQSVDQLLEGMSIGKSA